MILNIQRSLNIRNRLVPKVIKFKPLEKESMVNYLPSSKRVENHQDKLSPLCSDLTQRFLKLKGLIFDFFMNNFLNAVKQLWSRFVFLECSSIYICLFILLWMPKIWNRLELIIPLFVFFLYIWTYLSLKGINK